MRTRGNAPFLFTVQAGKDRIGISRDRLTKKPYSGGERKTLTLDKLSFVQTGKRET